jgi:hypothetical protein
VLGAGKEEEVHGRQQQQWAPLGDRRTGQERKHIFVLGGGAADGGIGDATIAVDHDGEVTELVAERLLDEHAG